MPTAKSEVSIFKTKGLKWSRWIKNGAIVKKTFKDWKEFLASTPPKKGWPIIVNQVRKATIEKY